MKSCQRLVWVMLEQLSLAGLCSCSLSSILAQQQAEGKWRSSQAAASSACWVLLAQDRVLINSLCCCHVSQKPETWRLACQTIVGDGANSGTVVIQTKPQK